MTAAKIKFFFRAVTEQVQQEAHNAGIGQGRIDQAGLMAEAALRSPNMNAYAELFIQSLQQECLDHFVLCGLNHLDHLVREYVEHCHEERPHQGLGNRPLSGADSPSASDGCIRCRQRLAACFGTTTDKLPEAESCITAARLGACELSDYLCRTVIDADHALK